MEVSSRPKVGATGDQRYTLVRIVVAGAEVIACRHAAPGKDDVAEHLRAGNDLSIVFVDEGKSRDTGKSSLHVQPPGMRRTRGKPPGALVDGQPAAGAWIYRIGVGAVRSRSGCADLGPAAEAGIQQLA